MKIAAAHTMARKGGIFFLAAAITIAGRAGQSASPAVAAYGPPAAPTPHAGQYRDAFTLADAGAPLLEMRGIDSVQNIRFALPLTHVARTAKIHLYYSFSPTLLPQLSHLKLMLNGTLLATVQPKPNEMGGSDGHDAEAEFKIPPELLVHHNTFSIEFSGHSMQTCEDPGNPTLWARVRRNSYFEIDGDLLPLADDLKLLPTPFLDPAVMQPLSLPIVFFAQPSTQAIQAAGIVASYFGMIAEGRPVRFPVRIGAIPAGNAIVIADGASSLPAGLNLPAVSQATVAMRTNPNDPYAKVLIVAGGNSDQTVQAAQAVAMHSDVLVGQQAAIANLSLPAKRQPDDAPRWARTDRRIMLADYAAAEDLQSDGSAPIHINFRIPPDLFYSVGQSGALHVSYEYDPQPIGPMSSMQVRMNDALLGSEALVPSQQSSSQMQADLPAPAGDLRPFSNALSVDFAFQAIKKDGCSDATPPVNAQGVVLRESSLDLRDNPHYAPMPNIEIFANAGFPFTRYADLSETIVVLPPAPAAQEIETFVTLMGHFGRQTGYPALRVSVAGPDALRDGAQTDFLLIGTGDDQPGFARLANALPVTVRDGHIQVQNAEDFSALLRRSVTELGRGDDFIEPGALAAGGGPDAVVEESESPFAPGGNRSVVAIHLADASSFEPFMSRFLDVQQSNAISGSVAVLRGGQFASFRIGMGSYHVGDMTLQMWAQAKFAETPWYITAAIAIAVLLLAIWVRVWLVKRARARQSMLE